MKFSKIRNRFLPFLFIIAFFCIYVYNLSPTIFVGDSPELLTAAKTLGIAHPPGYPVYTVVTNFLTEIFPFGNFAYRGNLSSALLSFAVLLIAGSFVDFSLLFYFALTPVFFNSALSSEVFALNLFFATLITLLLKRYSLRGAKAAAFLFGLGLANHQTLVLIFPAVLFLLYKKKFLNLKFVLELFLILLLGFSANFFLLVRAKGNPPLNWGDPSSFRNLLRVLLRKSYGTFSLHGSSYGLRFSSIAEEFKLGLDFMGPLFLISPLAYFMRIKKQKNFSHFLFISFLFTGPVFYFIAAIPGNENFVKAIMERFFLLPSFFLIALFGEVVRDFNLRKVFNLCVFAIALSFSLGIPSLRNFFSLSDFSNEVVREVPPEGALVIEKGAVGDDLIFALAYKKWAEGISTPEIFSYYGSVFPSVYGKNPEYLSPAQRQINRLNFLSRPREKYFFALSKNQIPFSGFSLNGLIWGRTFPERADVFWRLSRLKNYRVRSLEILCPYFRLLENPGEGRASVCEYEGRDIDWLLTNLGTVWLELGNAKNAERCYRRSLVLNPHLAATYNNLGVLLFDRRKYRQAAENFKTSAQLAPDDVRFYNLALSREKLGEDDEAQAALTKSLQINPFNYKSINELGLIKMRHGDYLSAKALFEKGLKINPQDENLKFNYRLILSKIKTYGR